MWYDKDREGISDTACKLQYLGLKHWEKLGEFKKWFSKTLFLTMINRYQNQAGSNKSHGKIMKFLDEDTLIFDLVF